MAKVYDYNGNTATQIKKIYDYNGTTATQIKKGYDHNGTTSSLIYNPEYIIFNGTASADYTGGWVVRVSYGTEYTATTSGNSLSMVQTRYMITTAVRMNSINKVSFSGYSTLNFNYSNVYNGNGVFTVGVSSDKTNYDDYDTATSLLAYNRKSTAFNGTVSINVASVTSGYIQISVFGSTGNNAIYVTKIWLS